MWLAQEGMTKMAINKSATKIGTLVFPNGNRNSLFVGSNRNTGETIVWQKVVGRKPSRVTGGNIAKLVGEADELLKSGGAAWEGLNEAAWAAVSK